VVELRRRGLSVRESGIGALIVVNLILSFTIANISVGAHIGGLIGGALAGVAFREADRHRVAWLGYVGCVALAIIAVAGALLAAKATGSGIA